MNCPSADPVAHLTALTCAVSGPILAGIIRRRKAKTAAVVDQTLAVGDRPLRVEGLRRARDYEKQQGVSACATADRWASCHAEPAVATGRVWESLGSRVWARGCSAAWAAGAICRSLCRV